MVTTKPATNSATAEEEAKKKAEADAKKKKEKKAKKVEKKRVLTKPERMKEALDKQDKVEIFIPFEGKEPKGAVETVIVNGYRFDIMKGTKVKVPQQIADIIHDSMYQTDEAHRKAMERAGEAEKL